MNSQDYWKKRAEEIAGDQFAKIDYYKVRMQLEYLAAIKSIQKEIQYFYLKFAQNNQISYVEALRLLKSDELEEFKMDLAEFTRKAKESKNEEWEKELNNVSYKVRITRLEALQTSINNSIENLFVKNEDNVTNLLKDIYEDTYHRNIFEIQKDTGVGTTFAKADDVALDNVISEKWKGSNYSERIWKDRDKLVEELKTNLSQSFIRGDSVDKTTKLIANRLDVDKSRARTLVNTESAYIAQKATFNGYEATGVEQYQILATLDLHTSILCRGLDGKVFNLSDKEIGVTAPPFHPNCRTTTVAYFEGMMFGERIARDSEGKVYYVDRNMTYKEWHDKYVKGNPKEEIVEKMIKNKSSDKKQYEEYKNILGDDIPKSFDKFQELKYNDGDEWNKLKGDYRKLNSYNNVISKEPKITSDLEEIANSTGVDMVGLDYRLKTKESYLRKINSDSKNSLDLQIIGDTVDNTNDVIRYTYQDSGETLVNSYKSIDKMLLDKGYEKVKTKNFWNNKLSAYKGVNCIYKSIDGQNFEVQFHTPESFDLKNGELHKLYEEMRLDDTSQTRKDEINKRMFELSAKLERPRDINAIV